MLREEQYFHSKEISPKGRYKKTKRKMKFALVLLIALTSAYVIAAAPADNSRNLDLIRELNNLLNSQERTNLLNVINTLLGNTDNPNSRGLLNVLQTLLNGAGSGDAGSLDVVKNLLTVDKNNQTLLDKLVRAVTGQQSNGEVATAKPGSAGALDLVSSLVGNKDAEKDSKDGQGLLNFLTGA